MNYFLPEAKISRDQGKVFRLGGRLIVPLYHPAAALRGTGILEALKASFKKLPEIAAGKNLVMVPGALKAKRDEGKLPQAKLF